MGQANDIAAGASPRPWDARGMQSPGSADITARRASADADQHARRRRLDALVREHHALVTGLAWRLLGWRGDVDDVVQDVFLRALRNMDDFRGDAQMRTWLTRITINACRSHRRRQFLRIRALTEFACRAEPGPDRKPSPAAPSDAEVAELETWRMLREAVARLPMRDREVIVLRYLQEMEVSDMAKVLELRLNAVEVRLTRARRRLRRLMSEASPDMGTANE